MNHGNVIVRFDNVSYAYVHGKNLLEEASFSVRENAKITIMGQNGAGKSTLFGLITGLLKVDEGDINIQPRTTIAVSRQIIPRPELELTVRAFFEQCFKEKTYDIDPRIDEVLEIVNLVPTEKMKESFKERIIGSFSGGQQARLLLAQALIQNPDVLLLDEPTNFIDIDALLWLEEYLSNEWK